MSGPTVRRVLEDEDVSRPAPLMADEEFDGVHSGRRRTSAGRARDGRGTRSSAVSRHSQRTRTSTGPRSLAADEEFGRRLLVADEDFGQTLRLPRAARRGQTPRPPRASERWPPYSSAASNAGQPLFSSATSSVSGPPCPRRASACGPPRRPRCERATRFGWVR